MYICIYIFVLLKDMCTKSQSPRPVDHINIMLHVVPILYVDILRKKASNICDKLDDRKRKRRSSDTGLSTDVALTKTGRACQAAIQLSLICEVTQKFSISENEISECEM